MYCGAIAAGAGAGVGGGQPVRYRHAHASLVPGQVRRLPTRQESSAAFVVVATHWQIICMSLWGTKDLFPTTAENGGDPGKPTELRLRTRHLSQKEAETNER